MNIEKFQFELSLQMEELINHKINKNKQLLKNNK